MVVYKVTNSRHTLCTWQLRLRSHKIFYFIILTAPNNEQFVRRWIIYAVARAVGPLDIDAFNKAQIT